MRVRRAIAVLGVVVGGAHAVTAQAPSLPVLVPATQQSAAPPSTPKLRADGSNLLRLLAANWNTVPLAGSRTYTQFVDTAKSKIYRYSEQVLAAGDGRFRLDLVRVDGTGLATTNDLAMRKRAFANRSGFIYHYRDFRVHDAALARTNYRVVPIGSIVRNRRRLRIFDILPRRAGLSSYRILVDDLVPIVLDQIEYAPGGAVLSVLTYDTVQLGPGAAMTISAIRSWWQPWMKVTAQPDLFAARRALDFKPRTPTSVADGFRLLRLRTTRHPVTTQTWLVLEYGDGIDTRFVLESKQLRIDPAPVDKAGSGSPRIVPVLRYRLGPVTQYLIRYNDIEYLVLGTFAEAGAPRLLTDLVK